MLNYERRILVIVLLTALPASAAAIVLVWQSAFESWVKGLVTAVVLMVPVLMVPILRRQLGQPLRTLSNLLAGLREGDYSINARGEGGDAMGLVIEEANSLVQTMREQRLGAMEAAALLQTVMSEIDVAVFVFDGERRLRLVNRSGERLLNESKEHLLGSDADARGLDEFLDGESPRTVQRRFPGGAGRWRISNVSIREKGRPHELLVISDLSRELREEERDAWQRLVRVFGHELNNSLAPIKSIAGSLCTVLKKDPAPEDLHEDLARGLGVIASRAGSLDRFLGSYARLAKLPRPRRQRTDVSALIRRVIGLETRLAVRVGDLVPAVLHVDGDQLEQALINLVRNAVDAALETDHAEVSVCSVRSGSDLQIRITDNGPGLANTANLFVPFFTTKPQGNGIGLALSRQIVEAHDGLIELTNRPDGSGCVARLCLPAEPG